MVSTSYQALHAGHVELVVFEQQDPPELEITRFLGDRSRAPLAMYTSLGLALRPTASLGLDNTVMHNLNEAPIDFTSVVG